MKIYLIKFNFIVWYIEKARPTKDDTKSSCIAQTIMINDQNILK